MGFFKTKIDDESLKEQTGGGSKYLSKSGIYDVKINFASVSINASNARSIDFNLDYEGNPSTIYGLKLDNNNGTENFGAAIFNKLCVLADLSEVSEPVMETKLLGKDNKPVDLQILEDFNDFEVKVRIQEEYSKYNGKISKRMVIKSFYRIEDGASASEVKTGENIGEQLKKDEAYADNITYRDCTAEEVEAWKSSQSKGGAPTPTPTAAKKTTGSLFK